MELNRNTTAKIPLDDELIIDLYWKRCERAIEETDFKYRNYLLTVAYNFVHDKLDSEECVNDTYLSVWNAIPPTRPSVLKAFLTTITRRAAIKRYHSKQRKDCVPSEMTLSLSELESFISGDGDVDADFDAKLLSKVISDFVRSLPNRKRFVFMSRYYMSEPIDTIAKELNVSRSTINKELAAIRSALNKTLARKGYTV